MKKRVLITVVIVSVLGLLIVGGLFVYQKFFEHESDKDNEANVTNNITEANVTQPVKKEPVNTSLLFTGDVLLSEYVLSNYNSKGIEGVVSSPLRDKMVNADFTMVNEEFPFSTRGTKAPDKQYTFRVDPGYISIFKELGINAVGIANNHVLDFGKEALEDTFTTLNNAAIPFSGAGHNLEEASKLVTYEKGGKKVGVIAASRVIPVVEWNVRNSQPGVFTAYDPTDLCNKIREAKKTCDLVYVMIHWGTEHTDRLEEYQKNIGHQIIDAGADGVIGAHPHVVQGIERYNGKLIFYSLGNFIFNQNIERTFALSIDFDNENVNPSYSLIPAKAKGATTFEMTAEEASGLYSYMNSISSNVTIDEGGKVL
ncbi:MAG TPA: capsular biosynthesis protein [Lachnospiraceae bacterium]|nr:capsular biosynthesis protein [Lachnospiraceae bacterium]